MKDQIAKSVFWMVWSRGGLQVLSFISTLLVARWLNLSDYGLMALAGIWTGTIAMLADMGLGWAIVQFPDVEDEELQSCFWMTLATTTVAYVMLWIVAPFIARWFNSPELTSVLRVSSVTLLLFACRLVPDAMLRRQLKFDKIAQVEIISVAAGIPLTLGLAWHGHGVWALVYGGILQTVVGVLALMMFYPWKPKFHIGGARLPAMLRFSLSAIGSSLGWSIYSQLDSLIVGKMTNEHTLGVFAMAKQLAIMPVTKISVVINQLAGPVMARIQDERERLRTSFLRLVRLVTCLTLPLCVGLALVAADLIPVALGEKWNAAVPLFQVFCFFALTHSVEVLLPPVLFARYRSGFLLKWTIALLIVMPGPFVVGAKFGGAMGVALAMVLIYPLAMVWMAREALKELDLHPVELLRHLMPVAVPTLLMALAVVAVQWGIPTTELWQRFVRLVAATVVGAGVYVSAVSFLRRPLANEAWEVMSWIFRRKSAVGLSPLASGQGVPTP